MSLTLLEVQLFTNSHLFIFLFPNIKEPCIEVVPKSEISGNVRVMVFLETALSGEQNRPRATTTLATATIVD